MGPEVYLTAIPHPTLGKVFSLLKQRLAEKILRDYKTPTIHNSRAVNHRAPRLRTITNVDTENRKRKTYETTNASAKKQELKTTPDKTLHTHMQCKQSIIAALVDMCLLVLPFSQSRY